MNYLAKEMLYTLKHQNLKKNVFNKSAIWKGRQPEWRLFIQKKKPFLIQSSNRYHLSGPIPIKHLNYIIFIATP